VIKINDAASDSVRSRKVRSSKHSVNEYYEEMNLQAQIELITVPQDFNRLCNAVLRAEYGDDFLSIDDDRSDRGNDGYLKSEKRMFAAHCFKRVQNQSLDREIRHKMVTDLRKAVQLNKKVFGRLRLGHSSQIILSPRHLPSR
jgi:hypothetical protein